MTSKEERGNPASARPRRTVLAVALACSAAAAGVAQAADGFAEKSLTIDGYLRGEFSWNAKNYQDTMNYNDRGKMSMARATVRVNADWKATDNLALVAKIRGSYEHQTNFLKHLEKPEKLIYTPPGTASGAYNYRSGARGNLMELYNEAELRELYVDWNASDRVKFRLGKQQVVWGETDFFAANDMVHGFNWTWRSFLEPANEELRKPLIILKANVDVPEANGALEFFVRPGWDRKKDIGTEIDIYGGRWSGQPWAKNDFRNIDPYDFENKEGDYDKVTGGIRWNGTADAFNYSVSYLKTFNQMPIMNGTSKFNGAGCPTGPGNCGNVKTVGRADTFGSFGDVIYPVIDVYGFTASGYAPFADAVFSTEWAYIKDAPYQFALPVPSFASQVIAPGFDGVKTKDVVAWMLRMDKNLPFAQSLLGAEKPMFFSVQLFDKWIQNFNKRDRLLNAVGWGSKTKEHSFLLTGIFGLSYDSGRIRPELVVGTDLTYRGGFYVPSVTIELSKNVRWKIEYDGFWDNGRWRNEKKCIPAPIVVGGNNATCDNQGLFGSFHNRDQFYTSLTYMF